MEIVSSSSLTEECFCWYYHLSSLEPGILADLIIVKSDSLANTRTLETVYNIKFVMKDGAIYKDHLAS